MREDFIVPFGYLRDSLFLLCFGAYWVNRFLENQDLSPQFLRSYLNDVICIPFWIPMMLWAARTLGLRQHDACPRAHEIVIPLLIWSVVFEVVLPATNVWSGIAVADPYDVLCYAFGGMLAFWCWSWQYRSYDVERATSA